MNAENRTIWILALACALGAVACVSLKAPPGYAERTRTGRYDWQAISTDASVVAVKVFDNEDPEHGDLAYWTEAARKQLTLSRGYEIVEQGDFRCSHGPGKWMQFSKKHRGVDFLYLLGLVVDGDSIYALEAGGEKATFAADLPKVIAAFASLK